MITKKSILLMGMLSTILSMCGQTEESDPSDTPKNNDVETGGSGEDTDSSSSGAGSTDSATDEIPVEWGRQVGTTSDDWLSSVTVDGKDNVWVAGSTSGTLGEESLGREDALLIKYDKDGERLATVQFGSRSNDSAKRVGHDSADNAIVVGRTFGDMAGENLGAEDVFVAKFSSKGKPLWTIQYGTEKTDFGDCLFINGDDTILVGGGTTGDLGGEGLGNQDGIISKVTEDGEILWHAQFGNGQTEYAQGIAVDSEENIYAVSSHFQSSLATIAKFSQEGELLNTSDLGFVRMSDIHINDDDEIFVSGFSGNQSKLVKLSSDFEMVWQKTFSHGSWSGEKEIVPVGKDRLATSGCMNYPDCYGFVRLYDFDGNLLDSVQIRRSFEASQSQTTCGGYLAADSSGAVYHVGGTQEDLFDTNKGHSDGFLAKVRF